MLIRTELKFLCTAILIAYDIVRQAWFSFKPQLAIFCPEMEFTKSEFSSDTAHGVRRFHSACEITAKAKRKISSKPLKRTIFILAKRNLVSFQLDFLCKLDFTIMRPSRVHSRIFTPVSRVFSIFKMAVRAMIGRPDPPSCSLGLSTQRNKQQNHGREDKSMNNRTMSALKKQFSCRL